MKISKTVSSLITIVACCATAAAQPYDSAQGSYSQQISSAGIVNSVSEDSLQKKVSNRIARNMTQYQGGIPTKLETMQAMRFHIESLMNNLQEIKDDNTTMMNPEMRELCDKLSDQLNDVMSTFNQMIALNNPRKSFNKPMPAMLNKVD